MNAIVWLVAYTNPNCEDRAALGLRAKGFLAFAPKLTKWAQVGKRREHVERPLFTRYLFVGINPAKAGAGDIRATDGVQSLVGVDGTPYTVSHSFVAELSLAIGCRQFDYTQPRARQARYEPGQKVRFSAGPFADLIGSVAEADDDGRVRVLLEGLGREAKVLTDEDMLRAA